MHSEVTLAFRMFLFNCAFKSFKWSGRVFGSYMLSSLGPRPSSSLSTLAAEKSVENLDESLGPRLYSLCPSFIASLALATSRFLVIAMEVAVVERNSTESMQVN